MNSAASNLPKWLQVKLNSCPRSPLGVHQFLFHVSGYLHHHMEPGQIEILLTDAVKDCGRPVSQRELREAISNAAKTLKRST